MHCENCGNQIKDGNTFCVNCGHKAPEKSVRALNELETKPWFRFLKVLYIFAFFILLVIVYFVFDESSKTWNYSYYSGGSYTYDYGDGIWYAFLTYLGGSAFLKLIKVSLYYVMRGRNPDWAVEFKRVLNPFY